MQSDNRHHIIHAIVIYTTAEYAIVVSLKYNTQLIKNSKDTNIPIVTPG